MISGQSIRAHDVPHGVEQRTVWSRSWVIFVAGICYSVAYWPFFLVMHLRSRAWASGQVLSPLSGYWNWFHRTFFSQEEVFATGRSSAAASHPWLMLASLALVSIIYLCLLLSLRTGVHRLPLRWLMGLILLASVPLLLLPNLLSSDVYSYIAYGRIAAIHGGNPFIEPPSMFNFDRLSYAFVSWKQVASVYGPAWIYISMLLTVTVEAIHSHIISYVLAYKLLAFGLHLTNGWLIWSILGRWKPAQQRWGTALYLLNPLTMIEFVGNAHNDVLMITFILLAVWFHLRGRWPWAIVALTLSVLTKWIVLLLLPLYGLALLWESPTWRERLWRTGLSLTLFAGLCVLLYRPYWEGPRTLAILFEAPPQKRLINSLADVVSTDVQRGMAHLGIWPDPAIIDSITIFSSQMRNASLLMTAAPDTAERKVWQQQATQWAQERRFVRSQLAQAQENREWLNEQIRTVALGILAAACLIAAAITRSFERALAAGTWLFFIYCAISSVWFWPWYLTWLVTLAALLDWRVTGRTVIMVTLLAPLIYIFFPSTANPYWWQQYRAVIVFLPPLLYASWHGLRCLRARWQSWLTSEKRSSSSFAARSPS